VKRIFFWLLLGVLTPASAQTPAAVPPAVPAASVPKGTVTIHLFNGSKIFPGTTRKYWVYVPQQYDPARPACVYIGQDGMKPTFPAIFDQLIASHQMPVTVGIFVTPGMMASPKPAQPGVRAALIRRNRSFEYNSLGDDYACFLLEEFLPAVVRETHLNLSTSGNDRCIGGGSSGASAAFTAAWEHPEAFSRVFSVSGAFPFARGDCYSAVVRKTEPKPIRVYLHVGQKDMYNANGDLFMDNEKLDRALAYTGYDVQYAISAGGHGDKYLDVFPGALVWLWRDWPAPVAAGAGSPTLQEILIKGEPWKKVGDTYGHIGGLTVDRQGEVIFSDTDADKLYRVETDGRVTAFVADARKVGALTVGADGTLYGASEATGEVVAFDADGKSRVIADGLPGHGLVATRSGGLYVSVPGPAGASDSKIWYVSPTGQKTLVDQGLKGAAGMAISADDWILNVSDNRSHFVYSYKINPDGTLTDREPFNWLYVPDTADTSSADGIAVDQKNRLFVATNMGLQTCGLQGSSDALLPSPGGTTTGVVFGGADFDTLYVACGHEIFSRKVKSRGINAFQPPVKFVQKPTPSAPAGKPGTT
jgi:sugar lactone lactonase YvrE/enterochelin esterase-like enzyme